MKKIVVALFITGLMLSCTSVFAQGKYGADSANCIKYLSYYKEYYKQKNYKEALPSWRKAYKVCPPTASQNMLLDGSAMIRNLIESNSKNATYRKALLDTLMTLHNVRMQNYPRYKRTALNNMGLDMANYLNTDSKALYDGLNNVISQNKEYTSPSLFVIDLNAAIDLYQKDQLKADDVINTYQNSLSLLDAKDEADTNMIAMKAKVKTDLENLFISSKVASCDNLIALYTPRYQASSDDLELVTNIVKMMGSIEGCTDNDLYMKAATSLYKLSPSYTSAYYLYRLNSSKGNFSTAVKYLEEAIDFNESDAKTDAQYEYELATYCYKNGSTAKAYECAKRALDLDPTLAGKCNYLIGSIWGATACGGNEIEKRAHYWVAVDYLMKARNEDPSLASEANSLIGQYSNYFPQAAEAFMYDITNGQSYTVSCGGMRATTTVRTNK
jgi:tetratricopeptide (TPR) repeat protein